MTKLTALRKPTAIAPGFTVLSYSMYASDGTHEEVVALLIKGHLTALLTSDVHKLQGWLARWRTATTDVEFGAQS